MGIPIREKQKLSSELAYEDGCSSFSTKKQKYYVMF